MGKEVPWLFDDVAQEAKTKDSTRIGTTTKEPHPEIAAKRPGTGSATGHYGSATTPYRLDPVLQVRGGKSYFRATG